MGATALSTAAEVLLATDHDPFARATLRRPLVRGWARGGTVVWVGTDPEERRHYLSALGEPGEVAELVGELVPELPPRQRVTLPRGTVARLPAWVGVDGVDWDFRWLAAAPARQPGEDRVLTASDAEVAALLAVANPGASAQPGDGKVRGWLGVPGEDGSLLACAADTTAAPPVGHLSSVAVHPAARGRGLGRAVTAALARSQFAGGCELVTLGHYADNAAGRALYDALGFSADHRFTSGPLLVRSRW